MVVISIERPLKPNFEIYDGIPGLTELHKGIMERRVESQIAAYISEKKLFNHEIGESWLDGEVLSRLAIGKEITSGRLKVDGLPYEKLPLEVKIYVDKNYVNYGETFLVAHEASRATSVAE